MISLIFDTNLIKMHETLAYIRVLESNDCKYIRHKSSAVGCYGMKPSTARELGVKDARSYTAAKAYYWKLKSVVGDEKSVIFGWLKGYEGLRKNSYCKFPYRCYRNHWHVKRYTDIKPDCINVLIDETFVDINLFNKKFKPIY